MQTGFLQIFNIVSTIFFQLYPNYRLKKMSKEGCTISHNFQSSFRPHKFWHAHNVACLLASILLQIFYVIKSTMVYKYEHRLCKNSLQKYLWIINKLWLNFAEFKYTNKWYKSVNSVSQIVKQNFNQKSTFLSSILELLKTFFVLFIIMKSL